MPGFEPPQGEIPLPQFEERWTGGFIFENEWQSFRTRQNRELELKTPFDFEFPQLIHGEARWCLLTHSPLPTGGCVRTFTDITERKRISADLEQHVRQLEHALAEVRELQAILPICMFCKRIRDDKDYWSQIDHYLAKHAGTRFSHGICPDCLKTHFPDQIACTEPPPTDPQAG